MKLRQLSLLLAIVLAIGLVPLTAFASATIAVNPVSSIHPGDSVTVSGTSTYPEVIVKVVRPSTSVVFFDIVKTAAGQFSTSFTLGSNEEVGTYKIVAGYGNDVDTKDLIVTATVTPPAELSNNADLSALTLSSGTLNPAFSSGTTAYTASVSNSVTSLTLSATLSDSKASLKVNGIATTSGHASGAIDLIVGTNAISVEVTAENGTKKTYSVAVTRASDSTPDTPDTPSTPGSGSGDTPVTSTDGTLTLPSGKTGEVSFNQEVTVKIPAGATNKELKLTIEKLLNAQPLVTEQQVLASPVFEILKNFTENFSKPVTLTFLFDKTKVGAKQKVSVFYFDETKKQWVEVGGAVSDNKITVDVDHFTKYAVFVVGEEDSTSPENPSISFSDIAGHWAEAGIKQAVGAGIVKGYSNGTFKPNQTVTRAEFAVMLMNALKPQEAAGGLTFKDAAKIGAWAKTAVAQAAQAGILKGDADGNFRPDALISRAEIAVMIARAAGQTSDAAAATSFADDQDIPAWAKAGAAYAKQEGIIQGKGNNKFAPQDNATRAEAVTVLLNLLAKKS